MLGLLAGVLGWDDNEREKAGLQRVGAAAGITGSGASSAPSIPGRRISSQSRIADTSKTEESEVGSWPLILANTLLLTVTFFACQSFSKMWVEFLLKEAAPTSLASGISSHSSAQSPPMSPSTSSYSLGPLSPRTDRRPSFQLQGQPSGPPYSQPRSLRATSGPLSQPLLSPGIGGSGAASQSMSSASSATSVASSVTGEDEEETS